VPDRRRHRGAHPEDRELFSPARQPQLRAAVADLAWLLTRGYAGTAALALVGDRHRLDARQRLAVRRATCSDPQRADRARRRLAPAEVRGRPLWVDGFNVLITIEAALAGGILLRCRDGCLRDMASLHGSYRTVDETDPAARALLETLAGLGPASSRILLDRPVSNSGRLRAALDRSHDDRSVDLLDDVDAVLRAAPAGTVVATADAGILDRCAAWLDLASLAVARAAPTAAEVRLAPTDATA
jgi:hypothetical protein